MPLEPGLAMPWKRKPPKSTDGRRRAELQLEVGDRLRLDVEADDRPRSRPSAAAAAGSCRLPPEVVLQSAAWWPPLPCQRQRRTEPALGRPSVTVTVPAPSVRKVRVRSVGVVGVGAVEADALEPDGGGRRRGARWRGRGGRRRCGVGVRRRRDGVGVARGVGRGLGRLRVGAARWPLRGPRSVAAGEAPDAGRRARRPAPGRQQRAPGAHGHEHERRERHPMRTLSPARDPQPSRARAAR